MCGRLVAKDVAFRVSELRNSLDLSGTAWTWCRGNRAPTKKGSVRVVRNNVAS